MSSALDPERIWHPDDQPTAEARQILRDENLIAAKYWGGFQSRIVITFFFFAAIWVSTLVMGLNGSIPLWLGLIVNTAVAATFYMPMHESVHRNVWGKTMKFRKGEDLLGILCGIPLLMSFGVHRPSHMRHHAFTNDADRDPDFFAQGKMKELPIKWYVVLMTFTFLPLFAFVPAARKLLPQTALKRASRQEVNREEGKLQFRFWILVHAVVIAAFVTGHGVQALMLWYIPARLQFCWLITVFAWFPHHPAAETGRYVDTRVAVFPGSGVLVRGHDHHALHHLFPRVPHYRLRALWAEMAEDLVAKGVRAEGGAVAATGPVVW